MQTACMACSTSMMIVDADALSFTGMLPAKQEWLISAVVACAHMPKAGNTQVVLMLAQINCAALVCNANKTDPPAIPYSPRLRLAPHGRV